MAHDAQTGIILDIHTTPKDGDPLIQQESITILAGRGIEGDRYFDRTGTVTLVEERHLRAACESIGVEYVPGASRRNITVRDIDLNAFVGKRLQVGTACVEGIELCEPCQMMEKAIGTGALEALVHKAGLRAKVVTDGIARAGDSVRAADAAGAPGAEAARS